MLTKLKRLLIAFLQVRLVSLFGFTLNRNISKYDISYSDLIVRSGIFPRKNLLDWNLVSKEWSRCYELHNQGHFQLAIETRKKILGDIYSFHNLSNDYFPPILSNQFFGAIGHNAISGIFVAAQNQDLIPQEKRIGIISPNSSDNNQISLYKKNIDFVTDAYGGGWTELPSFWHLTERHQMVRGKGGFIDIYSLIDSVFKSKRTTIDNSFFSLDKDLIAKSKMELREFGIQDGDWFVGLHVRDGTPHQSLRNQRLANYLPAIHEITRRGGWVIRIGDTSMPPLPKMSKVVDLVIEKNARKHLHLFVLSQSRFFIATCSGPLYFPSLFGVPTLFTNLIGIGRTTLPFSKNSIHLPKRYVKSNGLHASLTETLHSPFGFGELSMKEYSQLGISIHENSADEILASTVEMFERLEGSTIPDETQLDNRVNEIRTKFEWTSSGSFSTAFLSKNEEWFLK